MGIMKTRLPMDSANEFHSFYLAPHSDGSAVPEHLTQRRRLHGNSLIYDGTSGYGVATINGLYVEGPSGMSANRVEVTAPINPNPNSIFGLNLTGMVEGQGLQNATGYAVDVQAGAMANLRNITPANSLAVDDHNGAGYLMSTGPYVSLSDYATPRWILVRTSLNNIGCDASGCTITFPAVSSLPGVHVLVIGMNEYNNGALEYFSGFTVTGATQTLCPTHACAVLEGEGNNTDLAASINVPAGTTSGTITFNTTPTDFGSLSIWEWLWTGQTVAYDTGGAAASSSCSTCTAPSLGSFSGSNDAITVIGWTANTPSTTSACYVKTLTSIPVICGLPVRACQHIAPRLGRSRPLRIARFR